MLINKVSRSRHIRVSEGGFMKFEKYHKVTRENYEKWYQEEADFRKFVSEDPCRLHFHLMPETGWLNDPNGLVQADGVYHIYFQYTPFEPTGELKLWNHCTTRDFIHYEDHGPVLFPDHDFDAHGVYSGSAFRENGMIHYFYTGNVKYFDRPDYDYINAGRGSNTVHFASQDGTHFSEKELLMTTDDYPSDISCHVRDPKILKYKDAYYMALGARDHESHGLVLLYRSEDLTHWSYFSRIQTLHPFGYMWECPDLFFLDGTLCLICCPQGVTQQGVNYANVHQCTFMKIDADFENRKFRVIEEAPFQQVDRGFDFYAPQSFEDEQERRILIGWMGIPEADYTNPTTEQGWQHALTLPRELHVRNGRLIQQPIKELLDLRAEHAHFATKEDLNQADSLLLENSCGFPVFETELTFSDCKQMELALRDGVTLSFSNGVLTLDLKKGGFGRTSRSVELTSLSQLRIYSDTTSLEIFVNGGEEVFTTRLYSQISDPSNDHDLSTNTNARPLALTGDCSATVDVWKLRAFEVSRTHN